MRPSESTSGCLHSVDDRWRFERGDALALEMVERGAASEPAPTSVDERITRALAGAGRPVPLAELRAALPRLHSHALRPPRRPDCPG